MISNTRPDSLPNGLNEYEAALSNSSKSRQSDLVRLKKSEKAGSSSQYLRRILKDILPRALHDVCQVRPVDPIEYLAMWLYKAADSDLYFQDKALFEREKQKMDVQLKTEDSNRQKALERYKKHISELKICIQKEENLWASFMEATRPKNVRKPLKLDSRRSKQDVRRNSLFDIHTDPSVITSEKSESEKVSSDSSFADLPTLSEQRRVKPSAVGIDSVVSIRKDSSSSRSLHEGAFERSASSRTTSRTISRMLWHSQEDQDDLQGSFMSISQPVDTKLPKTKQVGKKEKPSPQLKETKGVSQPPKVLHPTKDKSIIKSPLTDVSPSYVSLGDRDKIPHDTPQDLGSTSQMQKATSTNKIKRPKERLDKQPSSESVASKHSEKSNQPFSGIGPEGTAPTDEVRKELFKKTKKFQQRVADDGKLSDDMTSLFSDQQMTEFEEGSQKQLSDEKDGRQRTQPELISADDSKLIQGKTTDIISPEEEQAIRRKRTDPELISSEGEEPIRRKRTEPELISSEEDQPIGRKRTKPELKSLKGEESLGRKTTEPELLSTTDEEPSSSQLTSQISNFSKKTTSLIDEPNQGFKLTITKPGKVESPEELDEGARKIDSKADISDEKLADDGHQDEEGISGKKKKTKKAKGKQKKSISRGSFDADTEEKPTDEEKDLDVQSRPSTVVFKLKQRKKKRFAKKHSWKLTDDEDTEYEDESQRFLRRGSSSSIKRLPSSLKQREDEDEEDEQQSARFKRKGSIKSITSMMDEDGKLVPRKRMKKRRRSIHTDVSDDASPIGIDAESIPKLSDTAADSAVESSDRKKRVRRRVKKHDAKSIDDELESVVDLDRLSPLPSQPPSTESSQEDLTKGARLSGKRGKPAAVRKRSIGRKYGMEPAKRSSAASVRRLESVKDNFGELESDYSETTDQSLDSVLNQLGMSTSTLPVVEETETFPFTPVECEWFLVESQTLVCRHPVLGDIRSRPAVVAQNFSGWPDRMNYNWRAFYDHEVYTVVDLYPIDVKLKRRPKEQ